MPATELKTKVTELKADVVPTRVNPLDQINERLEKVEQLVTRMDELEALIAKQEVTETPIIVDEVDEDAKRTYSERLAQIFNQLASNK
jgi:hypothetical protein